jgi:chromosome partitioning protein
MAKQNSILALVTGKGGSGKSTLACCLAAHYAEKGRPVTLIDGDPQGGASAWHAAPGPLQTRVRLLNDPSTGVTKLARQAAADALVIIDAAGFATQSTVAAIEAADCVLIPCRPSALDALRAIEMVQLARDIGKAQGRRLRVLVTLNAVQHGVAVTDHIRAELTAAKTTITNAEIGQRTAFAVAALNGTAPIWMGAVAEKAADEIATLAKELHL